MNLSFCYADNQFTIALTGKYPPFNFYAENGELAGFDVDVAKAIAQKLDQYLVIITTEWDGILAGLILGKYDAIIGSMAITPQRARKVNFSIPYYISGAQLFIHKENKENISHISDLYGKRVGTGLGETYEHYIRKNHPNIKLITYKSTVDIFQDMKNKRLDGFVTDKLVGLYQIKKSSMPFISAGSLLYTEKMGIPVAKENQQLLLQINKTIKQLKKEGFFSDLHKKWFGADRQSSSVDTGLSTLVVIKKLGKGFSITLYVAFVSILIGFILSIPSGIILNHKKTIFYLILRSFNDFIRGTPLLIQLFFIYFGAPQIGFVLSPIQAAIFTLSINSSAYMAEVIRSGLMAVNHGQILAGRSLGFNKIQVFQFIVWPQAFRIALPPLMNSVIALMKDTALIAVISVGEVIRETQSLISITYDPIKYYLIVGILFFIITFPLMKVSTNIEKRLKQKGFIHA